MSNAHFIHLIAELYNFFRTNVAAIMSTVLTVSFLNHFHRRMAIPYLLVIQMLCGVYILVAATVDFDPEFRYFLFYIIWK